MPITPTDTQACTQTIAHRPLHAFDPGSGKECGNQSWPVQPVGPARSAVPAGPPPVSFHDRPPHSVADRTSTPSTATVCNAVTGFSALDATCASGLSDDQMAGGLGFTENVQSALNVEREPRRTSVYLVPLDFLSTEPNKNLPVVSAMPRRVLHPLWTTLQNRGALLVCATVGMPVALPRLFTTSCGPASEREVNFCAQRRRARGARSECCRGRFGVGSIPHNHFALGAVARAWS